MNLFKIDDEHPRLQRFLRHKLALIGLFLLLAEILCLVIVPFFLPYDAVTSDYAHMQEAPSALHLLGTDELGRDMLARTLYGGRSSIFVGLLATAISACIGIPLGLVSGYYNKTVGPVVMRLADVFMSFPSMVLMLVVVSMFKPSIWIVSFVIGVIEWPSYTRLIYSNTLSARSMDYVEAARCIGCSDWKILTKFILPNVISPVWINITFGVANSILVEATLSFLGVGVQPPAPSWGNIIRQAMQLTIMSSRQWIWIPSGILLILTIVSINFLGDGIRDALDPQTKL